MSEFKPVLCLNSPELSEFKPVLSEFPLFLSDLPPFLKAKWKFFLYGFRKKKIYFLFYSEFVQHQYYRQIFKKLHSKCRIFFMEQICSTWNVGNST